MNWKSTAVVSSATILATWLGWTTTPQRPVVAESAPASRDARPVAGVDIQEQARKLQTRVRGEVEYRDPTRNPFRFGLHRPAAVSAASRTAATPESGSPAPEPTAPAPFPYTLAGIATDASARTAIIDGPGGALFVKAGDRVGTATVSRIDDTRVELVETDGSTRALILKP